MRKILTLALIVTIWFGFSSNVLADNSYLVPCKESAAYLQRVENFPDNYYFEQPNQAYAEYLTCGEDGLPHLVISFKNTVDIAIAFAMFFYITGFIGWSGRAYLQQTNKLKSPEEAEIFINLPLAIQAFVQGLLWPLLAVKELTSNELTVANDELSVSPR